MVVSSALLVSPGEAPCFPRQERNTSSVRLRRRREDVTAVRKQERHSGDFSYFAPRREEVARREEAVRSAERSDSEGEFNYISFPHGMVSVQDLRVAPVAPAPGPETSPVRLRPGGPQGHSPVRLRTNLQCNRAVSASVVNIRDCSAQSRLHQRQSGDFSQCGGGRMRPQPRGQEPGPGEVRPRCQQGPQGEVRMRHHLRSQSQQPQPHVSPAHRERRKEGNTKRCSGEFEFKKVNRRSQDLSHLSQVLSVELGKAQEQSFMERMVSQELRGPGDNGSEGSEESGVFSTGSSQESPRKAGRRPGLGRRALTQLDVRDRKNSYNSALHRSQDNLVKVCSDSGAEDVFDPDCRSIKKGLLWQQRDKLFSRWKERYFILTNDFLQCFKKSTSKITEMGEFIFKVKLSEVEGIELLDKRGYLTICLSVQREGKVYLRRTEGIRDWYDGIREGMAESRTRRSNRVSAIFADRRQNTDCAGMEQWAEQKRLARMDAFSGSTPEVNRNSEKERITLDELSKLYRNEEEEEVMKQEANTRVSKKTNRLSILNTSNELGDPDGAELGLDLEKGIFLRRSRADTDSGNNSLHSSSTGTASSKLSQPMESSFVEEDEEDYAENPKLSPEIRIKKPSLNTNIIEVRYRERVSAEGASESRKSSGVKEQRRRSQHVNRLQITHV